jgi:ribosomal-protein-alanine N-acetyltransferase
VIVEAGPAYAAVFAALHQASFPAGEGWDAAAFTTLLQAPNARGLLHAPHGLVLGRVAADEAEILTIAVLPGVRGQGIGRGLVGALLARLGREGITRVFLEVERDNLPALAVYRRAGFMQVGERRGYYGPGRDALVLARAVPA